MACHLQLQLQQLDTGANWVQQLIASIQFGWSPAGFPFILSIFCWPQAIHPSMCFWPWAIISSIPFWPFSSHHFLPLSIISFMPFSIPFSFFFWPWPLSALAVEPDILENIPDIPENIPPPLGEAPS